jgi:hypothetical protein
MNAAIVTHTLELVSERIGDPTPLVYQRLFAENPNLEPLFVRDTAWLVRGQMVQVALESLLDLIGGNHYAPGPDRAGQPRKPRRAARAVRHVLRHGHGHVSGRARPGMDGGDGYCLD